MKILVLGAGGTGGYFGGRLHEGGADVTFLVREKRAQHIAAHGLQLESPKDNATLRVKTVLAHDVKPEYDIVILSCKAYDLASSIDAIRPAMHDATCVVPLLNGISHIKTLDAAFGKASVMGGTAQIAATLTKDGVVKSMAEVQLITWGAREPAQQAAANALGEAFAKTSVDWKVSEDIMQDMWEKVAFLSTLAGMTCLMRASVGEIIATQEGAAMIRRYLDSCIAVAAHSGYAPRPSAIARYEKVLTTPGSTFTASMLRDLEGGGSVEADHIVGFMLKKAREFGIDDTMLAVAYAHLQAYENRRTGNRLP
ncbi:MAG: 2-dehydropantoate 2-reductase [Usitatibacteraceae bacterium]